MVPNQPDSVILDTVWGAIVEDVRTVFEKKNDATVYIPDFSYMLEVVGVQN